MDLLSFRPNANPTSKKNHAGIQPGRAPKTRHAGSLGHSASSWPLLQFLLVFDMARGHMDLLHPITKELVWQHAMFDHASGASSRTRIVNYFFASERMSYFATLSENGGISLYKLRVLHNKRLLSGDHRRQGRFDVAMCMLRSPHHYAHARETDWMGVPLLVPWRTSAKATTSPATNYLHIDFDLIFRTTGRDDGGSFNTVEREEFRDGKIAVVTFYTQTYVIAATARGEISFFHGENGTFIKTIDATHNGDQGVSTRTGSITQFKVMASGIVAFASGNRIQFINAHDQTTVRGVACEASLTDTITSIESDPWRHSTIYAGTSSGRGLVFRLVHFDQMRRKRKSARVAGVETEEDESEPSCVLIDHLLPKQRMLASYLQLPSNGHHQQHQTALRAIPGYLIMATNTETVLYRTSHDDMGPAYIAEHTHTPQLSSNSAWFSPDNATSGLPSKAGFVIGISVGKESNVHPASLAVHYAAIEAIANCSSLMPSSYRVDIYESLLPQPTSSLDIGWLRAPIMLLCAVGVMYWQQRQHTRNLSAQGLPPGFDLARFSEMAKR
uniref:Uncharacterized protein n=1 Tax=Globisporangium ultimum (strain ATCC 200006 / CBS 805.95 / DAOM BR144) TaxID=431595 RepID=K3X005_GLOUD